MLVATVLVVSAACASPPEPATTTTGVPAADVAPPRLRVDGMSSSVLAVDAATIADDGVHPETLLGALEDAGFVGATEREAVGGQGSFARIAARRLAFGSATGADAFVAWLDENAAAELFPATPFAVDGLDGDVLVLKHEPGGCCPKETRIYLIAWADASDVITVEAQGPRATDRAAAALIRMVVEANR
jgi:hypothetical protein